VQALAGQALHNEIRTALLFAGVEHEHDVWIGQPGGVARLVLEPLPHDRLRGEVRTEEFDCDISGEAPVEGPPNLAHPAAADYVANFIAVVQNLRLGRNGHAL
jgi:hypothetical protein